MATFEEKVQQQIYKLQKTSLFDLESSTMYKRITWCRDYFAAHPRKSIYTPRDVYELLFFEYMGLNAPDLPIEKETEKEIVWKSANPCTTLEACLNLGLDTRKICREAYEKSTQAFISQFDPQLRFLRSYQDIRPQAGYCLEWIVRVDFHEMMQIAIEEAKISRAEGNKGYGAVITLGNKILVRAHDTAVTEKDPSAHAEMNAIRQAIRLTGDVNLSGAILFSSCEPCPMCSSLAVWSNLTTIVFGASIEETSNLGKARICVDSEEIVARSPVNIEIIRGVLREECLDLYR